MDRASAALLVLWVLLLEAWFRGPLLGAWLGRRAAAVIAVALIAVIVERVLAAARRHRIDRRFAALVGSDYTERTPSSAFASSSKCRDSASHCARSVN